MKDQIGSPNDTVARQALRLQTLHAITRALLSADSVEDIAHEALSRMRDLVACDRAALGVFDWTTRECLVFAADVERSEPDTTGVAYPLDDLAEMLAAISEDEPFLIADMLEVDQLPPVLERYRAGGMRSNLQLALASADRPIGLLSLMSARPSAFAPEDVEVAAEVAALLAIAIHQSKARRAAIQYEQMKTDLLNVLAHELFTPVATIQGTALTLLAAGELSKDTLGELAIGVERAVARLKRLVGNINASARLDKRIPGLQTSLASVAEIVARARAEFPPDERLELHGPDRALGLRANADPELVSHAVVILLENALDFSGDQMVEVRVVIEGSGDRVGILVSDRGPGIPEGMRDRVFELFEQADSSSTRSHQGLGIGLFLARRIAQAFGGDIDIVPSEGEGATFRLTLPLAPELTGD